MKDIRGFQLAVRNTIAEIIAIIILVAIFFFIVNIFPNAGGNNTDFDQIITNIINILSMPELWLFASVLLAVVLLYKYIRREGL